MPQRRKRLFLRVFLLYMIIKMKQSITIKNFIVKNEQALGVDESMILKKEFDKN